AREQSGLREGKRYRVRTCQLQHGEGVRDRAALPARLFRNPDPREAHLGGGLPHGSLPLAGISPGFERGEELGGHFQQRVVGHEVRPFITTLRMISEVPPRSVNDGAARMDAARRRSNRDDESGEGESATSRSTAVSTSCSKRVDRKSTRLNS